MDDEAARRLAGAIIKRALRDARAGRPCDERCRDGSHICARDALSFLESPGCAETIDLLGADPALLSRRMRRLKVDTEKSMC